MNNKELYRRWTAVFLSVVLSCLLGCASLIYIFDPFFHYRGPVNGLQYTLTEPYYTNPGIAKNWDYDSIIIGTSMIQNFKTSQFDQELGTTMVKLACAGGTPHNLFIVLSLALGSNTNTKYVFYGLDLARIAHGADELREPLPEYLYDDIVLNDVNYLLNLDTLVYAVNNMINTLLNNKSTTMDEYSWHADRFEYDRKAVLESFKRVDSISDTQLDKDAYTEAVELNLEKNVFPLIDANPDVEFYFFYPPYSILYWDNLDRQGTTAARIETFRYSAERLLSRPNVQVYSFFEPQIICDLDNYKDYTHYSADINTYMADCMLNGTNQVTLESLNDVTDQLIQLVTSFDYDALYATE